MIDGVKNERGLISRTEADLILDRFISKVAAGVVRIVASCAPDIQAEIQQQGDDLLEEIKLARAREFGPPEPLISEV